MELTENKNILFESYIKEKEKEMGQLIKNWAHSLWLHYEAFVQEGFTEDQAMFLIGLYWDQVDKLQRQKRLDEGKNG